MAWPTDPAFPKIHGESYIPTFPNVPAGGHVADGAEPHDMAPIFTGIDRDHPTYLYCSCGRKFRVDYVE